jgi:integrase
MASIWKDQRSPNWVVCFTGYVGLSRKQFKFSTATTDKKLARRVADELEEAARGARSADRIKQFLSEVDDLKARRAAHRLFDLALRQTTGSGLGSKTTRGFITNWLERTKGEVSPATQAKYEQTAKLFLAFLEGKADQDMSAIRQDDIARFRDSQAKRVAASTANLFLKVIRIIFGAAEADGVVSRSEARHVKRLKIRNEKSVRRAFTLKELKLILEKCDDEWRSLVLFGLYTGQRLGDLAALTWQNLDLTQKEMRLVSRKSGRPVVIPLAQPLLDHITKLAAGDNPKQPIHSRAHEIINRNGGVGMLSNQFADILADVGLLSGRSHKVEKGKAKGRNARRAASEISFHSLRHTNVSLLKNAGVSDAIAQDLVGHDSKEMSRLYTHIDDKTKREAVNKLPVID